MNCPAEVKQFVGLDVLTRAQDHLAGQFSPVGEYSDANLLAREILIRAMSRLLDTVEDRFKCAKCKEVVLGFGNGQCKCGGILYNVEAP